MDFKVKRINVGNSSCKLQIWDTAGQERFQTMTAQYYRGANGVLIVYDVTNVDSFNNVREKWNKSVKDKIDVNSVMFLIGNKIDASDSRQISTADGARMAEELDMHFAVIF